MFKQDEAIALVFSALSILTIIIPYSIELSTPQLNSLVKLANFQVCQNTNSLCNINSKKINLSNIIHDFYNESGITHSINGLNEISRNNCALNKCSQATLKNTSNNITDITNYIESSDFDKI